MGAEGTGSTLRLPLLSTSGPREEVTIPVNRQCGPSGRSVAQGTAVVPSGSRGGHRRRLCLQDEPPPLGVLKRSPPRSLATLRPGHVGWGQLGGVSGVSWAPMTQRPAAERVRKGVLMAQLGQLQPSAGHLRLCTRSHRRGARELRDVAVTSATSIPLAVASGRSHPEGSAWRPPISARNHKVALQKIVGTCANHLHGIEVTPPNAPSLRRLEGAGTATRQLPHGECPPRSVC